MKDGSVIDDDHRQSHVLRKQEQDDRNNAGDEGDGPENLMPGRTP